MEILNIGTYPPKQCGIATFSWDLRNSLQKVGHHVKIMAISDHAHVYEYGPETVCHIRQQNQADYVQALQYINQNSSIDLVILQHEYGIFGGSDGDYILDILRHLDKPFLVVTHTVLPRPQEHQLEVLHEICRLAASVVCMTEKASKMLHEIYRINAKKISMIPHGVPEFAAKPSDLLKTQYGLNQRDIISTFGLIGPGKGLEIGIKAMAQVIKEFPRATYLILGQDHPMWDKSSAAKYRQMLHGLAQDLGISDNVVYVNKYLSNEELGDYLYLTDIYLSPYPNQDQAVSGTLAFAVGCGRAIVSTSYTYAREILNRQRGLMAPEAIPEQLAELIALILSNPKIKHCLQHNAYQLGKNMTWSNIGLSYSDLARHICQPAYFKEEKQPNYVGL